MLDGRVAWSAATRLRALSYPHGDRADDIAEAIAVHDARALLERFLDRYGHRLRLRGNGLAEALDAATDTLSLRAAWDPWAGVVARALRRDDPAPERAAVVAALVSGDWHWLVYVSAPHEPAALAELLVHEAAHQYQHLARRVGPLDDGSDRRSYWSPLKGMERPLSRLLAAYHAFGNVALVCRALIEAGVDDRGIAADRLAALVPALRATQAHLWENPALTPAGRAPLDPLMERLASLEG